MTDTPGGTPPFPGFPGIPGFSQADMMGKMWELMRLNPFAAAAMPGGTQGVGPSLSMMSDMLAPLTNIEELDKRVTDMRAVEQWLKLNLNMLQSAIQALEVQRATLATLRAFGAYAQTSVENAQASVEKSKASVEKPKAAGWPMNTASAKSEAPKEAPPPAPEARSEAKSSEGGANDASFDPSGWWNVLQSQFNQLASIAMAQATQAVTPVPGGPAASPAGAAGARDEPPAAASGDAEADAAAKKAPARKAAPKKNPE
jgi:hypothetical protein